MSGAGTPAGLGEGAGRSRSLGGETTVPAAAPAPSRTYHHPTPTAPREWVTQAACAGHSDPDIFFPQPGRDFRNGNHPAVCQQRLETAKSICQGCVVRDECLDHAIKVKEPDGVWGGYTTAERRVLALVRRVG